MRRLPLLALVLGLLLVGLAYLATLLSMAARVAPWSMAIGTSTVLGALLALAAHRHGRVQRRLAAAALLVGIAIAIGLAVALVSPAPSRDGPLLLGLPHTTTLMLLLVGLLPFVALPIVYALAFDREVMGDGDA
jgi:peptidoglycan/LPS O-acetylase OafA/YrhL